MANRDNFIKSGVLEYGLNSKEMNNALKEAGYNPLNKLEESLINSGRYGMNIGERFKDNFGELTGGLSTLVSGVAQHPIQSGKEAFNYLRSHTLPQVVGDTANAILSPFNLTGEDIGTNYAEGGEGLGGLLNIGAGAIGGALANPADAALMFMPEIGGLVGKGVKKAVQSEKLSKYIPAGVKGLVDPKYTDVNSILRDSRLASSPAYEKLQSQNLRIQNASVEDLSQVVKNLQTGVREGTEAQINLTNDFKNMVDNIDSILIKGGFNPELTKTGTINQYVTRYFQDKGIDIPVSKIDDLKAHPDKLPKLGVTEEEFNNAIARGTKLYGEGLISPIKHKVTSETLREGFVDEASKKVRGRFDKLYGTQSYEDVAKGIKSGAYDDILKTLKQSESSLNAIDEIIKTTGRVINDVSKLAEDEVLVSPKLLREKMETSLAVGENINSPLESLARGLNKAEREIYSDDLYAVKKDHIKALQNAYVNRGDKLVGGVFGKAANLAKTIALATPRYAAGNATTNFAINAITGTNLSHYLKALKNVEDVPEILRRTASYSGYLEDTLPIRSGYKDIYSRIVMDLKEGSPTKKVEAFNALFSTPIFKSANNIETIQRVAEYFNQVEKYAKEVGKTTDEIIKEAKANNGINKTYRELNRRVEQLLGDYTGRNYYANRTLTDIANIALPFYRPYTQAPRQLYNSTKNYRLGTQLGFAVPGRFGNNISEAARELYGVEPYETQGGYPVLAPSGDNPGRVIYNQYLPFSPVAEMLNNPLEILQGNPFLGAISRIASGKTRYNQDPLPPNTYRLAGGEMVILDNNGNIAPYRPEEHVMDRVKFTGSELLKTFSPVAGINSYILPTIALLFGQEYRKPADTVAFGQVGDFKIPGIMEGGTGRALKDNRELILPQLGFNYTDTYPEKPKEYTPSQVRRNRKQILKKIQRLDRR